MAVFLLLGMLRGAQSFGAESQLEGESGATVRLQGRILRAEPYGEKDIRAEFLLRSGTEGLCRGRAFTERKERLLLTIRDCGEEPSVLTGQYLLLEGTAEPPAPAANPGTFDYSLYLRSKKIYYTVTTQNSRILQRRVPTGIWALLQRLNSWKNLYEREVCGRMGMETGGTLCAVLFGDDRFLDADLRESFGENGIGHLLAASGLHTGFVYAILHVLFRRPSSFRGHIPILFFLALYAVLADLSASVVRAVLMIVIRIIGKTTFHRTDFLTNIAFCAGILLFYEPSSLFASGFQLSFAAVLTLAVVLPGLEEWKNIFFPAGKRKPDNGDPPSLRERVSGKLSDTLLATAAIQMGMVPVTLRHFHYISPGGILLNVPAIALAGFIVPGGILLMPVTLLWDSLPESVPRLISGRFLDGFYRIHDGMLRLLLYMNRLASDSGLACRYLPSPSAAVMMAYYGFLFLLMCEMGRKYLRGGGVRRMTGAGMILLSVFFACVSFGVLADGYIRDADMIFVDVGQGDCAHLKTADADILFDSGGSEFRDVGKDVLAPYLLGTGAGDVDLAVISHLHTDHYRGLCTLKDYVPVRTLVLSAAYRSLTDQISEETGVDPSRMIFLERGDRLNYGGMVMEVLGPAHRTEEEFARMAKDDEEENNCSLVVRASYKGKKFLFTGDISSELERELVEDVPGLLDCDVLKTPHHGSRYSSCAEFLSAAGPSICVIQVGARNVYGHPAEETLRRMEAARCAIFRNDRQGAVLMDLDGGLRVHTMRREGNARH